MIYHFKTNIMITITPVTTKATEEQIALIDRKWFIIDDNVKTDSVEFYL